MSEVRLKVIPGTHGRYSATDDGRIWSHVSQLFLAAWPRRDGYLYVMLRVDGRYLNRTVHRLVAMAWHGLPAEGQQVNHINLNKRDNVPSNLEWCTPAENSAHAWKYLPASTIAWMRERRRAGALAMNRMKRTLTPEQVQQVRSLLSAGLSRMKTARIVGTSRNTIDRLANGETYRD